MKKIKMTLELLSDTLSGSGEGFGAIIDSDVQYDDCGIPYISSKRIKGNLRNSLYDLLNMPAISRLISAKGINIKNLLDEIFGEIGSASQSTFEISNFYIEESETVKQWVTYLKNKYSSVFSNEKILSTLTNIRRQTTIDDEGVAKKHSLRTSRVVNKNLKFVGEICYEEKINDSEKFIALACANLRRIGIKRNRGLGKVKCLLEGGLIDNAIEQMKNELEAK